MKESCVKNAASNRNDGLIGSLPGFPGYSAVVKERFESD